MKAMNKHFLLKAQFCADENTQVLKIPKRKVKVYPASAFFTKTTIAALSEDSKTIGINANYVDFLFRDAAALMVVVAHECRHAWQALGGQLTEGYQPSNRIEVDSYNAQIEEIDAWAWAFSFVERYTDSFRIAAFFATIERAVGEDTAKKIVEAIVSMRKHCLYLMYKAGIDEFTFDEERHCNSHQHASEMQKIRAKKKAVMYSGKTITEYANENNIDPKKISAYFSRGEYKQTFWNMLYEPTVYEPIGYEGRQYVFDDGMRIGENWNHINLWED